MGKNKAIDKGSCLVRNTATSISEEEEKEEEEEDRRGGWLTGKVFSPFADGSGGGLSRYLHWYINKNKKKEEEVEEKIELNKK